MRFSYIDSEGKEIEVDSIDSLALRIELGAVQADTRMYDAVADRWAPAEEHPVYRSLSRGEEVTEDDIVPIGAGEEEDEVGEDEAEEAEAGAVEAGEAEAPAGDSDDALGLDFQVSMAEDDGEEGGAPEPVAEAAAEDEGGEYDEIPDFDLGGVEFEEEEFEEDEEEEAPELEDPEAEPPAETLEPEEPAGADERAIRDEDPEEADDTFSEEEPGETRAAGEGEPMETESFGPQDGGPGDLPPWAQNAPAWDDEQEPAETPGSTAEAPGPGGEWSEAPGPGREAAESGDQTEGGKRAVPERPAHWDERDRARERKQRLKKLGLAGVVAVVVGVGAAWLAGVGGFGPSDPEPGTEDAEATSPIPVLPAELREALDRAGEAAWATAVERAVEEAFPTGVASEPPPEWLQGHYLSNAGQYPQVGEYWRTMVDFASATVSDAESAFPETLRAELEGAAGGDGSVVAGEVSRLHEIGLRELELSAARRDSVVGRVRALAVAAVELHRLLVDRQEEIVYEPYSAPGVSRDPVLEAVPETEELRVEMNERLDRVLTGIEESRLSRPITTEGFVELVEDHLRRAGWEYRGTPPFPEG